MSRSKTARRAFWKRFDALTEVFLNGTSIEAQEALQVAADAVLEYGAVNLPLHNDTHEIMRRMRELICDRIRLMPTRTYAEYQAYENRILRCRTRFSEILRELP